MTTTLVVGATGMTGRRLVDQLLGRNHRVRVVARSPDKLSPEVLNNPNMTVINAAVLDLTDQEMTEHVRNCDAIVSCLGHVMEFKGIFGEPRQLCTDATRRLCTAIENARSPVPTKFILMNSVGVADPDQAEDRTWYERGLLFTLRHCLPPHRDNETAAAYLSAMIGRQNEFIEWCSVRPDSLIDAEVTAYDVEESPSTGILTGRPTTRANVAHFMAELVDDAVLWTQWKFGMPVIMNTNEAE